MGWSVLEVCCEVRREVRRAVHRRPLERRHGVVLDQARHVGCVKPKSEFELSSKLFPARDATVGVLRDQLVISFESFERDILAEQLEVAVRRPLLFFF